MLSILRTLPNDCIMNCMVFTSFLELEACELSHKELNDYLVATLSKTNMDEVIDVCLLHLF